MRLSTENGGSSLKAAQLQEQAGQIRLLLHHLPLCGTPFSPTDRRRQALRSNSKPVWQRRCSTTVQTPFMHPNTHPSKLAQAPAPSHTNTHNPLPAISVQPAGISC